MLNIFASRRKKIKDHLEPNGLDAFLVQSPANRYYLSGFELHDPQCNESAGYLLITPDEDYLLTDPRYLQAGKELFPENNIFVYTRDKYKQISGFLSKCGVERVGFEPQWMSYEFYEALRAEMLLSPEKGWVENLRMVKDSQEIQALRKSCALNHKVFYQLEDLIRPGLSEAEVAWEAEKLFREQGAQELSFSVIAAAGENAALPHATPGEKVIQDDMPFLVDMGCRVQDYCSDQSRTFWIGNTQEEFFKKTRDRVRRAQDKVIAWMGPGKSIHEAYEVVVSFFAGLGVDKQFTHSLGHGIGLETHESPSLGPNSNGEFLPGMVVTVEPGLYYPDWGGVRWEYMVLITSTGVEIL